jgi:tRNA A22 N-methylase
MSGDCCEVSKPDKIGGFDSWEVRSKADTLIEAEEIANGDQKFYKVVLAEVQKKADAAMEAAKKKKKAADSITLEKKVGKKMKKVLGGSGD